MFKPGDLVMVVKPLSCCGHTGGLGAVFEVARTENFQVIYCERCRAPHRSTIAVDAEEGACATYRLRLIPPFSEDTTTERELEAA